VCVIPAVKQRYFVHCSCHMAYEDYFACTIHCRTPLHFASCMVRHECVMSLTASGAKINVIDTKGCSPLHYAAAYDADAK